MDASTTHFPAATARRILAGGIAAIAIVALAKVALHLIPTAMFGYSYLDL
jgi:uncharacterized RDD family membrane protein YckC